tara:strand:+ start:369 stop:539 length:171 start_codon:yes stop_codon:yes gene_type:complete
VIQSSQNTPFGIIVIKTGSISITGKSNEVDISLIIEVDSFVHVHMITNENDPPNSY